MLVGIVGRPNSGKSTFFKSATLMDVLIASYPFATIKPNHGMAYVKIQDLAPEFGKVSNPREGYVKDGKDKTAKLVKGYWRFVQFELMDVAGLVEGASEGKGLGNEFLNDLATADAFIHVVDMSGEFDGNGKPVSKGDYYPGFDIIMIERELDMWYYGILKKVWKTFSRVLEMSHSNFAESVAKQFSGLKVKVEDVKHLMLKSKLNYDKPTAWTEEDVFSFARELRKNTKPMVIAANKIDRPNGEKNYLKIKEEFDYPIIPCFADGELALREADKAGIINYVPGDGDFEIKKDLNDKQKNALENIKKTIKKFGSTGVQETLNKTILDVLKYVCIFPAGEKLADSKGNVLPDCFLMPPGSTALDFAFRLHSDIGDGFVKAIHIKTKKPVGKDYKLMHRDGLEIITR